MLLRNAFATPVPMLVDVAAPASCRGSGGVGGSDFDISTLQAQAGRAAALQLQASRPAALQAAPAPLQACPPVRPASRPVLAASTRPASRQASRQASRPVLARRAAASA